MDIKKIKILIAVIIIIVAIGVAYALDFSKWKSIKSIDSQLVQINSSIQAKKSYYAVIDSKIADLSAAGWAGKKDSIMLNYDSSLFFTPKINTFFKTIVASSGMALTSMTSSSPTTVKAQAQPVSQTENGSKISQTTESASAVQSSGSYFDRLQGPIRKTTVDLTVTGTYSAFKNLLSLFQNQTRIVTIKSVAVSQAGSPDGKAIANNLTFSVILDVYSY